MSRLPSALPAPTHAPLRGGPVLRWGILGPGAIAADWTSALHAHTDQRVVAVGSRSSERAEAFARRHGIERAHGSADALVADPGVDAVYIASPHPGHLPQALLAIAAGKHVLVEKPLALNAAQVEEIAAAARAAGVFAMEAMWSRFLPQTTVLARLLEDGVLGDPLQVSADFGSVFPVDPTSRAYDPALGGGALLDLGVYPLWFASWVLGEPDAVHVAGSLAATGVDEQAVVTLQSGRAVGIASCSMVVETKVLATIHGTAARATLGPPFCAPSALVVEGPFERAGTERLEVRDPEGLVWREGLCYPVAAVAAHVAEGRTEAPEHTLADSIRVLRIIDHARAELGAVGA